LVVEPAEADTKLPGAAERAPPSFDP